MNILVDIIPVQYRKYALYAPYALVGLVLGALSLVVTSDLVDAALKVYAFVGSALGLTAYANTNAAPAPAPSTTPAE